jgi:hypothetical protein
MKLIQKGSKAAATRHMRWMIGGFPCIARVICREGKWYIALRPTSWDRAIAFPNPNRYTKAELKRIRETFND